MKNEGDPLRERKKVLIIEQVNGCNCPLDMSNLTVGIRLVSKDFGLRVDCECQPEIVFSSNTPNGVYLLVLIMFQYLTPLPFIIDKHITMSILLEYTLQFSNMRQVVGERAQATGWLRTLGRACYWHTAMGPPETEMSLSVLPSPTSSPAVTDRPHLLVPSLLRLAYF